MRSARWLVALAVCVPLVAQAQAGQVVGPGGVVTLGNPKPWTPFVQSEAQIEVTKNNPRVGFGGYGSGSLEMSVTGHGSVDGGGFPDWGFWYDYASGAPDTRLSASYGSLRDLSALSFDWYRSEAVGSNWSAPSPSGSSLAIPPVDWRYKTPVMRLRLAETDKTTGAFLGESELIWEGYYNQCSLGPSTTCSDNWTKVNKWNEQKDMQNGNFWYVRPPASPGIGNYLIGTTCTLNTQTLWAGQQGNTGLNALLGINGCLANVNVDVIGVAVGVGSQWPLPYHGFVDNVQLGFGTNGTLALNSNFDFVPNSTVPEPSTYGMLGVGLIALAALARRRKNRD